MSRQGLAQNEQKCQFCHGQKTLIFPGEIKSFVTHITENPSRHLVQIGFWLDIRQNVHFWSFGPNNGIFGHFGPGLAGSFGALLVVGWWLWRAGSISQDTYLLYIID